MDKRTRERIEIEKLREMIRTKPKLKSFLDAATDESDNKELKDLLQPVLADEFTKIRTQGINIGWYAHAARCKEKIKNCKTIEEAIAVMEEDEKYVEKLLGIKPDVSGIEESL